MARIVSAPLEHSLIGSNVRFDVDLKIQFDSNDVGFEWRTEAKFYEHDTVRSDDYLATDYDRILNPSVGEVNKKITIFIPKSTVNTEVAREEVFAYVKIYPIVNIPKGDTQKTGLERVNV